MLLELAIGDAYGFGFEYCDENLSHNTLKGYVRHRKHMRPGTGTNPGDYSDDTQMSIAIAELLVERADWTPLNIAKKFVEVFRRDPLKGYSGSFYDFLRRTVTGEEFLANIRPDSDKSGGAMRAAPIGVLPHLSQVKQFAEIQAAVTHNTPDGIRAAQASALMTHFFLHRSDDPTELPYFIAKQVEAGDYRWDEPYSGPVGSKGHMSVRAAITAVSENRSLSGCLKACIAFSGDVDTVATIAMAAASCCRDYRYDLPQVLVDQLQNRTYGRDYLNNLNNRLSELL